MIVFMYHVIAQSYKADDDDDDYGSSAVAW